MPDEFMNDVEYRDIPGYQGYRVGDDGSIWSRRVRGPTSRLAPSWSKIKGFPNRSGHIKVGLRVGQPSRVIRLYVHKLVLEAFVGPCPPGLQCRHLDGNPANNHLGNLCWGTFKENIADRIRHGRGTGERIGTSKLSASQIREIRDLRATGLTQRLIGEIFGIGQNHVSRICAGKCWTHLNTGDQKQPGA